MGFLDKLKKFFRKEEEEKENIELLGNPLERLKKGDIVELDGETWEVVGVALYDYGASKEKEWELRSATRRGFLSMEEGKIYLFEEIDPQEIKPNLGEHYRNNKRPPSAVIYKGKEYKLKYAGKANYVRGLESAPVTIWEFKSDDGEIIDVEIWNDYDIEVFKGRELREWEIENVLPR